MCCPSSAVTHWHWQVVKALRGDNRENITCIWGCRKRRWRPLCSIISLAGPQRSFWVSSTGKQRLHKIILCWDSLVPVWVLFHESEDRETLEDENDFSVCSSLVHSGWITWTRMKWFERMHRSVVNITFIFTSSDFSETLLVILTVKILFVFSLEKLSIKSKMLAINHPKENDRIK